jgi:hypothetical protein
MGKNILFEQAFCKCQQRKYLMFQLCSGEDPDNEQDDGNLFL